MCCVFYLQFARNFLWWGVWGVLQELQGYFHGWAYRKSTFFTTSVKLFVRCWLVPMWGKADLVWPGASAWRDLFKEPWVNLELISPTNSPQAEKALPNQAGVLEVPGSASSACFTDITVPLCRGRGERTERDKRRYGKLEKKLLLWDGLLRRGIAGKILCLWLLVLTPLPARVTAECTGAGMGSSVRADLAQSSLSGRLLSATNKSQSRAVCCFGFPGLLQRTIRAWAQFTLFQISDFEWCQMSPAACAWLPTTHIRDRCPVCAALPTWYRPQEMRTVHLALSPAN